MVNRIRTVYPCWLKKGDWRFCVGSRDWYETPEKAKKYDGWNVVSIKNEDISLNIISNKKKKNQWPAVCIYLKSRGKNKLEENLRTRRTLLEEELAENILKALIWQLLKKIIPSRYQIRRIERITNKISKNKVSVLSNQTNSKEKKLPIYIYIHTTPAAVFHQLKAMITKA